MLYRLILPKWKLEEPGYDKDETPKTIGDCELSDEEIAHYNAQGYNCYYLPNYPSKHEQYTIRGKGGRNVSAKDVDVFEYVFVDMDLKEGKHASKESFLESLADFKLKPSAIVDSGNGIHAYWRVTDLDPMSFLRIQRRLCRHLVTDETMAKLVQLMRVPGTKNTKDPKNFKSCELIHAEDVEYTCEQLDQALPPIQIEDEAYCKDHYNRSYGLNEKVDYDEQLPKKWFAFAKKGTEAHKIFYGKVKDRSTADYRLGHLLHAGGFTEAEALSVLVNTSKASERSADNAYNYAINIVDKVWEEAARSVQEQLTMGSTVFDLMHGGKTEDELRGMRFPCDPMFDATQVGFRLGHVMGLVGGAGSGKTTMTLNYFYHFVKNNPEYVHVFFSLEQTSSEIAERWMKMTRGNPELAKKVIVVDNYNTDGTFRDLSIYDCEEYVKSLQASGLKVGCVVIDHIGILKAENRNGDFEGIMDICKYMKAFAINTNTFLVMQSQSSREKAGIGDIELSKDAAYGTSKFEWFVDWLVTTWQPLKRIYNEAPHMTVTCYKYCKIRHKKVGRDRIVEDNIYACHFDPETELMSAMTDEIREGYEFFAPRATALRVQDIRKDPRALSSLGWTPTKRVKGTG